MFWWLIPAGYPVGWFIAARMIIADIQSHVGRKADGDDVSVACAAALFLAVPLAGMAGLQDTPQESR